METFLRVTFHSEGAKPSEVADRLQEFGFAPTQGNYDFVYDWRGGATREQLLDLLEEVTRLLRGYHVYYEVETV
ncbi:MAG TPA: hypothetical protein VFG07_06150 [Thermoplasmata archaeon]|nr:hypothetical protein [Thermoplasmata archaeon]